MRAYPGMTMDRLETLRAAHTAEIEREIANICIEARVIVARYENKYFKLTDLMRSLRLEYRPSTKKALCDALPKYGFRQHIGNDWEMLG